MATQKYTSKRFESLKAGQKDSKTQISGNPEGEESKQTKSAAATYKDSILGTNLTGKRFLSLFRIDKAELFVSMPFPIFPNDQITLLIFVE